MADAVLNTNEENREVFTTIVNVESCEEAGPTICSIEAVTPDRNVAITVRFMYDSASSFWTDLIVLMSMDGKCARRHKLSKHLPLSMNFSR